MGRKGLTMIRVRLTDPEDRHGFGMFLTFANLGVHDDGVDTLLVDFANFDLDEQAQLRVVNRMLDAWRTTRRHGVSAEIAAIG
jgi:hypothetical protein